MIGLVSFWREADTWRESVRPLRRFTPLPDAHDGDDARRKGPTGLTGHHKTAGALEAPPHLKVWIH